MSRISWLAIVVIALSIVGPLTAVVGLIIGNIWIVLAGLLWFRVGPYVVAMVRARRVVAPWHWRRA